jgi:hypothetical protein
MASRTETAHRLPEVDRWRGGLAAVAAVVGTVGIFWWISGFTPVTNTWLPSVLGLIGLEVPYAIYNDLWQLVRIALGAYITMVFLIVALQLVGTWRRLIADQRGEH